MSFEQNADFAAARQELANARAELLATLDLLTDADLGRSRRGGWPVNRVVQHIIQSEWHYARLIAQLRGEAEPPSGPVEPPSSPADAVQALAASRAALHDALQGIDEPAFFRLATVGREEYSVLSVLENVAHHDREHGQQVRAIITPA